MNHHLKRQLRRLATERPYQVVAGSAAALLLATGTGALFVGADESPARQQTPAAVAEAAPRLADVATRAQARVATTPAASPSPSASATPAASPTKAKADPDVTRKAAPKPPSSKILDYDYEAQFTYYTCGPAAVRNALSAAGIERTQDELAGPLGTTEMGTNSAQDTTRVLNQVVKGDPYRTRMFAGTPSAAQIDRLRADIVAAVTAERGVVANVAGTVTDTDGGWHSFPGGHYVAVVGYRDGGELVRIADSADPNLPEYWLSTTDLANWIATRGYSA
ncbi:C39 family peptidase [Micromonospora coxensis]|uniref:Peptidase_C39 like family protein n=1 Tax=Micromonospora coxensis TaxID=356852 RepID=A0A1C5JQ63_9ACTN|nr:C39 family peptidase [Micromonospora coxensis]SCG72724.1 Peptidase_C39 like family protein [Micromonospora coxensis]